MRRALLAVTLTVSGLFSTAAQSPSAPVPQAETPAYLVYTPNPGRVELRYLDREAGRASETPFILPPFDAEDDALLRLSAKSIETHPRFDDLIPDLNWILNDEGEFVFAQTELEPGDYALLYYDARPEVTGLEEDRSVCWRDQSRVLILRFRAGKSYYLDAMEAHRRQMNPARSLELLDWANSAPLFAELWPQVELGFRAFRRLDPQGPVWFEPPEMPTDEICAINPEMLDSPPWDRWKEEGGE